MKVKEIVTEGEDIEKIGKGNEDEDVWLRGTDYADGLAVTDIYCGQ